MNGLRFEYVRRINVMIASPGGMEADRDLLESMIRHWNIENADAAGNLLFAYRWEDSVSSILGTGTAQDVIDDQLLLRSHVLIALFSHRFGSPVGKHMSGTEHEVDKALKHGLRVHLFFSDMAHGLSDINADQLRLVQDYRRKMQPTGVVRSYDSEFQLRDFASLALTQDIAAFKKDYRENVAMGVDGSIVVRLGRNANTLVVSTNGESKIDRFRILDVFADGRLIPITDEALVCDLHPSKEVIFRLDEGLREAQQISIRFECQEGGRIIRSQIKI